MKVAVLMLSFERYETLKHVLEHNLANAGYPFDLFVWDNGSQDDRIPELIRWHEPKHFYPAKENKGIAAPLNDMIRFAYSLGYDAFHVMANDILEPDNWLSDKVEFIKLLGKLHIPLVNGKLLGSPNHTTVSSGMVSIPPGEHNYPEVTPCFDASDRPNIVGPIRYYPGDVIGQFLITREVYEAVGAFREDFGYYGPIDNDYNVRCAAKGFVNYYIPGQSIHLGDDNPGYGYDKGTVVQETWPRHVENVYRYLEDPTTAYIPPSGECTINMKQFEDGRD
ncbi:glycosyltransferase family 2 protein [Chitinophaga varians]|uniref:glycosyltransferase family 2 protein n=1 Tax=Chitinophaga varians TaxID=2202339 RepID=UPI00165FBCB7|nr:glycosyltransferase family 2 protein [Chitinophaga varians]MBC9913174.1 glycosyltransferase family 2 protein [Chitinophaga varians]